MRERCERNICFSRLTPGGGEVYVWIETGGIGESGAWINLCAFLAGRWIAMEGAGGGSFRVSIIRAMLSPPSSPRRRCGGRGASVRCIVFIASSSVRKRGKAL